MKSLKYSAFFFLLSFLLSFSFVYAQDSNSIPVKVNDTVVFRLFNTDREDASAIAEKASKILNEKFESGASADSLETEIEDGGGISIYWGTSLIVTVTKEQALKHNSEPSALAKLWLKNIISAAAVKPLEMSASKIVIALGDSTSVTIGGNGKVKFKYPQKALEVSFDEEESEVKIHPLKTGEFDLVIIRRNQRGTVKLIVKERAGKIDRDIELEVTGMPASTEVIKSGVLWRIPDAVTLKPGASVYLKDDISIYQSIIEGDTALLSVPVILEGPNYITVEGTVKVRINNTGLKWKAPSELFISNRPEIIKEDGILFNKSIPEASHVRMMYSHKNGSDFNRKLAVSLKNKSPKPVKLLFRNAAAGPDKFEMYAGHKAAYRYMALYGTGSGYVLEVPAFGNILILEKVITPNFLFSGICDIEVLEGKGIDVKVETFKSKNEGLKEIDEPFDPFKIHPHGVFPVPEILNENKYKVSSGDLEITVGKWPWVIDAQTGEPNTGNFGVVYTLSTDFINDTSYPVTVDVLFTPLNGTSQGTFIIDGELIESKILKKDTSQVIKQIKLRANETLNCKIVTIPEASSCYPVQFLFTSSPEKKNR